MICVHINYGESFDRPPWNYDNPTETVFHSKLRPADAGRYKSECPKCRIGMLPVRRDDKTFNILKEDNCLLCGQHFIYADVDNIGKERGGER